MTTPTPEPAAPPADTTDTTTAMPTAEPDTATPEDANPDVDTEQGSPNSEAAKRRRQLRETQTELSTVRDQLTGYQRRTAEQIVSDVLATPGDLFEIGQVDLTEFIGDNGDLHTEDLLAAATALVERRPQLGRDYTPPWPATTDFGQGVRSQSAPSASWDSVLNDQRRRQYNGGAAQ